MRIIIELTTKAKTSQLWSETVGRGGTLSRALTRLMPAVLENSQTFRIRFETKSGAAIDRTVEMTDKGPIVMVKSEYPRLSEEDMERLIRIMHDKVEALKNRPDEARHLRAF